MDEIQSMTEVPEVSITATAVEKPNTGPALSFQDGDFAADIEKLRASMTVDTPAEPIQISQPPTTPAQPEKAAVTETEQAKPEVKVPDKFKAEDGSVDKDKLGKSLENVEQALATYLAKEKELKRKMNDVRKAENGLPLTGSLDNMQVSPEFAAQFEKDVQSMGLGAAVIRLQTATLKAAEEAAYTRAMKDIEGIKNANAEATTKTQIESIGKNDPWVYTPEGVNTLTKMLDDFPYLRNAEDPYKAAYLQYSGMKAVSVSRSGSQVLTTTPPVRPSAPVPTGQAVNQTQAPAKDFSKMSQTELNDHLKTLSPKQQSEFFKKLGYPSF